MKISANDTCPCGSSKKYKKCCRPFHENISLPKKAAELMRSRYCAFKLSLAKYIIDTTHQNNSDFTNDIKTWQEDILLFTENTDFKNLEILEEIDGEDESFVTFRVTLFQDEKDASFTEKSRFLKENNKWLYVNGEFK